MTTPAAVLSHSNHKRSLYTYVDDNLTPPVDDTLVTYGNEEDFDADGTSYKVAVEVWYGGRLTSGYPASLTFRITTRVQQDDLRTMLDQTVDAVAAMMRETRGSIEIKDFDNVAYSSDMPVGTGHQILVINRAGMRGEPQSQTDPRVEGQLQYVDLFYRLETVFDVVGADHI